MNGSSSSVGPDPKAEVCRCVSGGAEAFGGFCEDDGPVVDF